MLNPVFRPFVLLLALPGAAQAGEVETWFGGAASGGVVVGDSGSGLGVAPTLAQAEVDARLGTDLLFIRVDLDVHMDPANLAGGITQPLPPEWAMLQIGREQYHVRLGVTNPNIGLQQWDEWQNYLPSTSILWAMQPAQIIGAEPGMTIGATDVFVYGGWDMAWQVMTGGAGFAVSQDSYYAALAVAAYPLQGTDYYSAFGCFEYYPLDQLYLSLDGGGGVIGGGAFAGGQLQVVIIPEFVVSPTVRGEYLLDPGDVTGLPTSTAGAGLKISPLEFISIGLEGKATFDTGAPQLSAIALLSVFRPEPDAYDASYPVEEEE